MKNGPMGEGRGGGLTENGGREREDGIGESQGDGGGWKKTKVWGMKRGRKSEGGNTDTPPLTALSSLSLISCPSLSSLCA